MSGIWIRRTVRSAVALACLASSAPAFAEALPAPVLSAASDSVGPGGSPVLVINPPRVDVATEYRFRRIKGTFPDESSCWAAMRVPPGNMGVGKQPEPGGDLSTALQWVDDAAPLGGGTYTYTAWAYSPDFV